MCEFPRVETHVESKSGQKIVLQHPGVGQTEGYHIKLKENLVDNEIRDFR